MTGRQSMRRSLREIFVWPLVVSVVSVVGLVCALVGDGSWDVVSWLSLTLPLALYAYFFVARRAN
jgi:hypothetical protein